MLRAISGYAIVVVVGALLLACDESPSTSPSVPLALASVQPAVGGSTFALHFTDMTDCANLNLIAGFKAGMIELCQDNSPSNPQTFLTYSIVDCTSECTTVEAGAGFIPTNDFQGSGTSQERLSTNTSAAANPAFERYVGNGGSITLTWKKTDVSTERYSGGRTTQLVIGGLKEETAAGGMYVVHSATVDGSIIGIAPAPGNTAFMSANRSSNVTVQHLF